MKDIKAIFIDLDGTLVGHNGEISKEANKKLQELIDKGLKVVIATGRNYVQARIITKNIQGLFYITNNGAYVVDDKGNILSQKNLVREKLLCFLEDAKNFGGLNLFIQNHERIVTNSGKLEKLKLLFMKNFIKKVSFRKLKEYFKKEINLGHIVKKEKNIFEFIRNSEKNWLKVLVLGDEKKIENLALKYKDEFSISFSASGNIEVNEIGVSKGEAIKKICETYEIRLTETLCFGDSGNDIEMFKVCAFPVVMGNSKVKELYDLSKFQAQSYEENGVYEFLREHF